MRKIRTLKMMGMVLVSQHNGNLTLHTIITALGDYPIETESNPTKPTKHCKLCIFNNGILL